MALGSEKKTLDVMAEENSQPQILVGCQGWGFDNWKTLPGSPVNFFPYGIRPNEKLSFYSKIFDTVEADSLYRGMPKASDIEKWYRQVPEHFRFSLKVPKDITHVHSLSRSCFPFVKEFIKGISLLKDKVAVILIQLPETFKMTRGTKSNLEGFLDFLPGEYRFVMEFRSKEWFNPEIFALLERHNAALCLGQDKFLLREVLTRSLGYPSANFSYFRFGGSNDLTKYDRIQRPQDESMAFWAEQVRTAQSSGKECFVYFGDFFEGHAPGSAMKFRKMLGQTFPTPEEFEAAPSLF